MSSQVKGYVICSWRLSKDLYGSHSFVSFRPSFHGLVPVSKSFKGSGICSALCGWKGCNGVLVMQDSGKWICGVKTLLQKPGCVVYSFGSNGQTGEQEDNPSCSHLASLMYCCRARYAAVLHQPNSSSHLTTSRWH